MVRKFDKNRNPYKSWTTARLKEVLDENYCRGKNGHDYEPVKTELQDELWRRENANSHKEIDKMLKDKEEFDALEEEYNTLDKDHQELEKKYEALQAVVKGIFFSIDGIANEQEFEL